MSRRERKRNLVPPEPSDTEAFCTQVVEIARLLATCEEEEAADMLRDELRRCVIDALGEG